MSKVVRTFFAKKLQQRTRVRLSTYQLRALLKGETLQQLEGKEEMGRDIQKGRNVFHCGKNCPTLRRESMKTFLERINKFASKIVPFIMQEKSLFPQRELEFPRERVASFAILHSAPFSQDCFRELEARGEIEGTNFLA